MRSRNHAPDRLIKTFYMMHLELFSRGPQSTVWRRKSATRSLQFCEELRANPHRLPPYPVLLLLGYPTKNVWVLALPLTDNTYGFIKTGYHFSPLSFLTLLQSCCVVFSGRLSRSALEIVCFEIKLGETPCLSNYSGAKRRLQEYMMSWF